MKMSHQRSDWFHPVSPSGGSNLLEIRRSSEPAWLLVPSTCVGCPVSSWRPCTGDSTTSLWEPPSGRRSRSGTTRWDTETDPGATIRAQHVKPRSIFQLRCWCSRLCCHSRPSRRRTPAEINNSHNPDTFTLFQHKDARAEGSSVKEGSQQANEARLTRPGQPQLATALITWLQMQ